MPKRKRKKKSKIQLGANKAFSELVDLYEIADTLEENNEGFEATRVRAIADKVGKFILNLK